MRNRNQGEKELSQCIQDCQYGDFGIFIDRQQIIWKMVLNSRDWSHLIKVDIYQCRIRDSGVKFLTRMKWQNLKELSLANNQISDIGFNEIIRSKAWPKLRHLWLDDNKISDHGIGKILDISSLKLKTLFLNYNELGTRGIKFLTKLDMPNLGYLSIQGNQEDGLGFGNRFNDEAIRHLAKFNWPKLKIIHMSLNNIGIDGLHSLVNYQLRQWDQLDISTNIKVALVFPVLAIERKKQMINLVGVNNNSDLQQSVISVLKTGFMVR